MSRIHKLPEELICKIAAGEVIERPFSVVKELVENSIDAGSTHLEIDIEDGGRKLIRVIDDGIGMSSEEALLALERHATSKIKTDDDLSQIHTLGFRGEAMPSIAVISHMTLETRSQDEEIGVRLDIEGGKVVRRSSTPRLKGTRITIENLFFNTPARLKFMKSKETEFSHIASWVEAIALSRPDIGFILRHQQKVEIQTEPTRELRTRIRDILGVEVAEFMKSVSVKRGDMGLAGYVSDHRASSTSSKSIFLYVNGRFVRDRLFHHAVQSSYETLLMKHRYPFVVLHLQVPPDFVDVNVHPAKSEVRFANTQVIYELIRGSLRAVLTGSSVANTHLHSVGFSSFQPSHSASDHQAGLQMGDSGENRYLQQEGAPVIPLHSHAHQSYTHQAHIHQSHIYQATETKALFREEIKMLGQLHGTYLVGEAQDRMILVDQHAAHERIGFEKLKKEFESGKIATQQLLIPQSFDLRPSQTEVLKKYLEEMKPFGLEIDFFGGNTFLLRTTPTLLEGSDFVELIEELVESLQSFEKLTPLREKVHEVLERMACHAQVRAGDRLSQEEIYFLLDLMKNTENSGQCPHGRPAILQIPFSDVERWFKRKI